MTETDYTLIGARHGWRVTRETRADGKGEFRWSCAECWRARKRPPAQP